MLAPEPARARTAAQPAADPSDAGLPLARVPPASTARARRRKRRAVCAGRPAATQSGVLEA